MIIFRSIWLQPNFAVEEAQIDSQIEVGMCKDLGHHPKRLAF